MLSIARNKRNSGPAPRLDSVHNGIVISPGGGKTPHGSTYIRILERLKVDYQPGLEWDHVSFDEAVNALDDQDFIIVQRNSLSLDQSVKLVELCAQSRVRLLFEIDDDLTIGNRIPEDQILAIKHLLTYADCVITSTPYLRKKLRKYNHDVRVVPNKLCSETWLGDNYLIPPKFEIEGDGVKILYMGTYSHAGDLDIVRPALDLLNQKGIKATVHAIGIGQDIESATVKSISIPDGWGIYPKFVSWLRANSQNFDFAIAPLENNEFNCCKSGLKYLDYGAINLPGIFSESVSYSQLVKNNETGLLVKNNIANWLRALERMCVDPRLRSRLASAAFVDIERHHLLNRSDSFIYAEAMGIIRGKFKPAEVLEGKVAQSEDFDPHWYVHSYDPSALDMGAQNILLNSNDAMSHYLSTGASKNYDPSPTFSTGKYLERYADVKEAGLNAFTHYLNSGKNEGRQPSPNGRTIPANVRLDAKGPISHLLPFGDEYTPSKSKIAVHLHAFHLELVDDVIEHLANVQQNYTLLVSAKPDDVAALRDKLTKSLPLASLNITAVENRGRDVAPWVVSLRDEIIAHDIFCHIHTKKTVHTDKHKNWRSYLLHEVLASPASVSKVLSLLDNEPDVGLISPPYLAKLSTQPQWGANRDHLINLLNQMNYEGQKDYCEDYPAGSFFWVKTEVLKPLFDLGLTLNDFEIEAGQNDGTLAHAIERLMGYLPSISGFDMVCTAVEKTVD